MAKTSTKVFILEVMGRHAGWIAAAGGLAGEGPAEPPHVILFPEIAFDEAAFLARIQLCVERYGYAVVVVSEGARYADGRFLADAGTRDAFGHVQLGGAAPVVANLVRERLGLKFHYAIADYLQRAARHIASGTDLRQAYAVGQAAVKMALAGDNAVLPIIKRTSDQPYRWRIDKAPLAKVANREKKVPRSFITRDGFGITAAGRRYLAPLIKGDATPPYRDGLPVYPTLKRVMVKKRLKSGWKL